MALVKPIDVDAGILLFEIPVMILFGLVLIPLSLMKQPMSRISSFLLFMGYVLFVLYLYF